MPAFDPAAFDPAAFDAGPPPTVQRWSDLNTWEPKLGARRFPTLADTATFSASELPLMLDVSGAQIGNLTVQNGMVVDAAVDVSLDLQGNLIVDHCDLTVQTQRQAVFRILNAVEANYVGSGAVPLASDWGFWVYGGRLIATGIPKQYMLRATAGLVSGQVEFDVAGDASTWAVGDSLLLVPTRPCDSTGMSRTAEYDEQTVASITDRGGGVWRVRLSSGLVYDHPIATDGLVSIFPEVLNMTRNIRFEGTPTGRVHFTLLLGTASGPIPSSIQYVQLRYMGPRRSGAEVIGRWSGFHFHMIGDLTRGTVLRGTVTRDGGSWGEVPHGSHGITYENIIVHETGGASFRWDDAPTVATNDSNDISIRGAVFSHFRNAGELKRGTSFKMSRGLRNSAEDVIIVGSDYGGGSQSGSGIHWPESNDARGGVWALRRVWIHNCTQGIFGWWNSSEIQEPTDDMTVYHCRNGWLHGAYDFTMLVKRLRIFGNGSFAVSSLAVSGSPTVISLYEDCTFDASGTLYAFENGGSIQTPSSAGVNLVNPRFRNASIAGYGVTAGSLSAPRIDRITNPSFDGCATEFWFIPDTSLAFTVLVQGGAFIQPLQLRAATTPGQPNTGDDYFEPRWNCSVRRIAGF